MTGADVGDVRASRASPRVLAGIGLATAGYALFSAQDAIVKWLVVSYSVPQVLLVRSLVIVAIALAVGGPRTLGRVAASPNKRALALRACLILGAWFLYYSASRHLGLAQLTTLYFASPVIAVVLAVAILRERVDAARWAAVGAGFIGVVVAARPTGSVDLLPAALALLAACLWGCSVILVRWIGRSDRTSTQVLASNALFALGSSLAMPWLWRTPDPFGWVLMGGLGIVGGLGQFLLFEGFRLAPASVVAPVEYTGLVWAFVYGYAIWGDVPTPHVVAGAGLVAASSLALVWFELARKVAPGREGDP